MNKLRRDPAKHRPSFPSVDQKGPFKKGTLAGNMMGYESSKSEPKTSHVSGVTSNNMMGYSERAASGEVNQKMPSYGNKPLAEPTRSGFDKKTLPEQNKNWTPVKADNPEWTQIPSVKKKKGAFYG